MTEINVCKMKGDTICLNGEKLFATPVIEKIKVL